MLRASLRSKKILTALAACLVLTCRPLSAYAEDAPFQLDTGTWMSFDHYQEKSKSEKSEIAPPALAPVASAALLQDAAPAPDLTVPPSKTAAVPVVASPTRPLNLPVMPGIAAGYSLHINSTEDDRPQTAHITHIDSDEPTVQLPEQDWQNAKDAALQSDASSIKDSDQSPLDVRMSFLPNNQIKPVPEVDHHKSRMAEAPVIAAVPPAPPKPAAKSPAEVAACAAVDAYKKKQLQALESDRQTLAALQTAINQMGLKKQLSFMTGESGGLDAQVGSNNPKMDMPVAASTPPRN